MSTIWKYPLEITDYQNIEMPKGSKVLSVHVQKDVLPCLWALVESELWDVSREIHTIHIFETGQPNITATYLTFIGMFILSNENFVGHVFESVR